MAWSGPVGGRGFPVRPLPPFSGAMMDLPQCWAYNSGGERCEKHAGHPGQHAITRSWTDSECASPGQPPVKGRPLIEVFAEEEAKEQAPSKCVACQHQHKGGPCKCGCHEHIG